MAKLPPQPLGVPPGSSYWNDWYEKLRTFVDQITTSVDWSIITGKPNTLAGYGITDGQTALVNSAGLAAALSDETGTGLAVFNTSPTLVTPVLGAATGTSLALGGGTALTTTNRTGTGNLVLQTSPTINTNIGVNMAPVALIQANASTADGQAATWNTNYTVTSVGSTSTSPGVGISYDTTANAGNISFLQPGTAWRGGRYRASTHSFYQNNGNTLALTIDSAGITVVGDITTSSTTLHKTSVALTNGAAAGAGTLLNAPAAGNPTKWIPIVDNGTTRYIPAW